ncbi:tetratricopeptide repeat-containing sensor histidine kinase [Marinoscillum furvescens]|uniref:Histidine kinase/DNA gyrase B/HSP90-like ATPase n=1 Tax=Marinoscillum furvescens DSM 4134 TaxID=1122208 RepID=A0A3D9L0A3_MARFU|nr:sensor histidine kinase [Marinoscillum furvescens]RED95591.1 histidine kinase/DNA gyrase B/HSP90-like ATPase [Marinoscillum furvescens DSM 4134]
MRRLLFLFGLHLGICCHATQQLSEQLGAINSESDWETRKSLYTDIFDSLLAADIHSINKIVVDARANKDFDFVSSSLSTLAEYYLYNISKPDSALLIINAALADSGQISTSNLAQLWQTQGNIYHAMRKLDSAKYAFEASVDAFETINDTSRANLGLNYLTLSGIYLDQGDYLTAVTYLDKAQSLPAYQYDRDYKLQTLNNRANLYSMNGMLDQAVEFRKEIIATADNNANKMLLAITYLNYASEARKLQEDSLEIQVILDGLTLADTTDYTGKIITFYLLYKLTEAYSRQDMTNAALEAYQKMDFFRSQALNVPRYQMIYDRADAEALYCLQQFDAALTKAQSLLTNALQDKDAETIMDMHRLISRIQAAQGNFEQALNHYQTYNHLHDSLTRINRSNAVLYMETLYESERKKRIISDQNNKIQLLATSNAFNTKLLWGTIMASIMLIGMIYLFRSRQYALAKTKLQQTFSQKLLDAHETERKRIARDLHDGVGQSLILLKNNANTQGDESLAQLAGQTLDEVRSISRALHPALLTKLGISASIEKMLTDLDESTDILFSYELAPIDGLLPPDMEVHLYRFLQEALNNLIKHSKTTAADLEMKVEDHFIHVMIEDYGVGFDPDITKHSLGMRTLYERAAILGGQLQVNSMIGKGTSLSLKIPLAHA